MNGLVDLISPRSWRSAFITGMVFLLLINLVNYAVSVFFRGVPFGVMHTSVVAVPFVVLIMAALRHQRDLQHKLTLLASTDMLTGLPNRRAFIARATEAAQNGESGALLLLDADHFKLINDTWGHSVGDICLTAIAEHLRRTLRPGDIVGRMGGEEFSIFLPGATVRQAQVVGERLCRTIAVAAEGAAQDVRVTMSIGATLSEQGTSLEKLMAQADYALYRAKAEGRARMIFWSDADKANAKIAGWSDRAGPAVAA